MKEMVYIDKSIAELLDSGTYEGYEYAIVSRGLHPCAYVKLPEGHKYYGTKYYGILVDCHLGLTYSESGLDVLPENDGWWIGWDYGHCCDYNGFMVSEFWLDRDTSHYKKWTTAEIFKEVKQVINQLQELNEFVNEAMRVGASDEENARDAVYLAKYADIQELKLKQSFSSENTGKSLREVLGKLNDTL